ncbi:MAG: penicillin-insensitive murein endopeptidase [Massilia sp.]|nr:penicillin-insensitive murein endopeptidase [Massilia sp.]
MVKTVDDPLLLPDDSRSYFMLPQSPAESGYYTYGKLDGKPDRGAYQYAHPLMMTAILRVGLEWQAIDKRRFGVGNISLPGGRKNKDHKSHMNGLQVDIRPLRKDGLEEPVTWMDAQYDQASTIKLIELFRTFAPVTRVFFNAHGIPFVMPLQGHDDHFHVELRG